MDLSFAVEDAAPVPYAGAPTLRFALRVGAPGGEDVRSILLDTQLQIVARARGYDVEEQARLLELFGPPAGWGRTLRTLLWARTTTVVPPFRDSTNVDVDVPCTYDLDVAASRYFDALRDGTVPLELLFSGTVFTRAQHGLQAQRISWEQEASYDLPVAVWKAALERSFAGTAWIRVGKERLDALAAFKARRALPTFDDALDVLLRAEEGRAGESARGGEPRRGTEPARDAEEAGTWTT